MRIGNFSSKLGLEHADLSDPQPTPAFSAQVAAGEVGGWAPSLPGGNSRQCNHRCLHWVQLGGETEGQTSVYFPGLGPQITEHPLSTCMIPVRMCVCVTEMI